MQMDARVESAPLTVEQMGDMVSRLVQGVNASDPTELVRGLFGEDGEFTADLIASVPRLVSAAAQAIKAFAESMEGMPAEKGAELMAASHAQVSGAEIAEAVNALSRLVIRIHEQSPDLLPETRVETMSDFMLATDFGKLRKAVTYRAGERLDLLRREIEILGDNPMALINIFSVVAPVVNDALPALKAVFDILALPAEAVTYALFKIVQDLEWQDVAAVINGAAAFIVNVHRGSLILGDGSLYTRAPFQRVSAELVAGLDGQVLAEAMVAVGEEGEAFSTALANKILEDESLALPLLEATVSLANSFFRAAASIAEKANSLPQETLGKMVASAAGDLEVGELGRALVSLAAFNRRIIAENPELIAELSRRTLTALELDLRPEAAAAGLNQALASYNGWIGRNPDLLAEKASALFAEIDTRELERAARATGGQLADALSRNPAVLKPLLKAAISVLGGSVKGYLKGMRARRKTRGV
jgi:hypothetical protein